MKVELENEVGIDKKKQMIKGEVTGDGVDEGGGRGKRGWGGGSRSNFMVELSLSQLLGIAKQFTITQSINLSRATGTHCP